MLRAAFLRGLWDGFSAGPIRRFFSRRAYLEGYRAGLYHAAFYVHDHCSHGEHHAEMIEQLRFPGYLEVDMTETREAMRQALIALEHARDSVYGEDDDSQPAVYWDCVNAINGLAGALRLPAPAEAP